MEEAAFVIYHQTYYYYYIPLSSLLIPPPCPYSTIIEPSKSHHRLNPDAEPFSPQQQHPWVPHKRNRRFHSQQWKGPEKLLENNTSLRGNDILFPNTIGEAEDKAISTVMIRNLPNHFRFEDLLLILDEHCLEQNTNAGDAAEWSKFDFVYLPMDYRRHAEENKFSNLGYAFVNFSSPSAAFKFYKKFHGLEWNVTENRKICEINAAQYQGKEELIRTFSEKVFRCRMRDFLPVLFEESRDGLNRLPNGRHIGKYVWGLPLNGRRIIQNRAYLQKH